MLLGWEAFWNVRNWGSQFSVKGKSRRARAVRTLREKKLRGPFVVRFS